MNECTLLLTILSESEELGFINIFTGDESWFYIKFNRKGAWILPDEKVPFFENPGFQLRKFMLTVIWGINGIHVIDIMDSGLSFNSDYFITHILCQIEQIKIQKTRYRKRIKYYLHLDNCKVHNSKATQQKVDSIHFLRAHIHHIHLMWHPLTFSYLDT